MDMNYVEHYKMYYQFIAKYNEYQTYPIICNSPDRRQKMLAVIPFFLKKVTHKVYSSSIIVKRPYHR